MGLSTGGGREGVEGKREERKGREREGERKGLGEGRHTTSFTTTHTGRAMRKNLWFSLVSSK